MPKLKVSKNSLITTLKRYAGWRNNDHKNGLESAELSALLVEKYAVDMVDAIRTLGLEVDVNKITSEADSLCRLIDPDTEKNRLLRYKRVAKLDLSEEREPK